MPHSSPSAPGKAPPRRRHSSTDIVGRSNWSRLREYPWPPSLPIASIFRWSTCLVIGLTAPSRTKQPSTSPRMISRDLPTCDRHVAAAFERRRRFGDARAGDMNALDGGQPRHSKFVDVGRKRDGADIHPRDQRVVDDIDGELLGHADIVAGVLVAHVGVILDPDSHDGRVGRQAIEEAEWRRVDHALLVDCRDESDRARNDGSDEKLVAVARRELREIKVRIRGGGFGDMLIGVELHRGMAGHAWKEGLSRSQRGARARCFEQISRRFALRRGASKKRRLLREN